MKALKFSLFSLIIFAGCKDYVPVFVPLDNSFTFTEAQTTVPVTKSTTSFDISGKTENDNSLNVCINVVEEETTAIAGVHYVKPKWINIVFVETTQEKTAIEIIPENITEEVCITFRATECKIMTGGIDKTVIRLIPTQE